MIIIDGDDDNNNNNNDKKSDNKDDNNKKKKKKKKKKKNDEEKRKNQNICSYEDNGPDYDDEDDIVKVYNYDYVNINAKSAKSCLLGNFFCVLILSTDGYTFTCVVALIDNFLLPLPPIASERRLVFRRSQINCTLDSESDVAKHWRQLGWNMRVM